MSHKFTVGQEVYFDTNYPRSVASGLYTVVRIVPVENDDRLRYRIKSASENFERVAEEYQLTGKDEALVG